MLLFGALHFLFFFFFNDPATTEIYTLSLHDALPISPPCSDMGITLPWPVCIDATSGRSEEHTSELQSHLNIVCRLLLEKQKKYSAARTWRRTRGMTRSARGARPHG